MSLRVDSFHIETVKGPSKSLTAPGGFYFSRVVFKFGSTSRCRNRSLFLFLFLFQFMLFDAVIAYEIRKSSQGKMYISLIINSTLQKISRTAGESNP